MAFDQADYFLVPLLDGQFGVGQIFELPTGDETAPFCGLTAKRVAKGTPIRPLLNSDVIAFVRVDPAALLNATWPIGGFDQIPKFRQDFDYEAARALGFPYTPIHDPAIIEAFLSAWHGLYAWDAFGDLFAQIKRAHLDRPASAT
jgi:hypothetical protein